MFSLYHSFFLFCCISLWFIKDFSSEAEELPETKNSDFTGLFGSDINCTRTSTRVQDDNNLNVEC